MSYEWLIGLGSFLLTLIGAGIIGSKLNESKHRKEDLKDSKRDILDLTSILEQHDRISKEEREAIEHIPNINPANISRVLHEWPEVSGNFSTTKKTKSKDRKH